MLKVNRASILRWEIRIAMQRRIRLHGALGMAQLQSQKSAYRT